MKKVTGKKFFLYFMVYISILSTMTSTWVNKILHSPVIVNQLLTALVYLPFVFVIVVQLVEDVKEFRSIAKKPIECIYYLFALYYTIITGYRFLNGMEVKENLYYSIIFFGAIALYLLIRSKKIKISKSELATNLLLVDLFFVLYRLLYCLVGVHFIENPPININLTSGAVAILTPFVGHWLVNECSSKRDKVLYWLVLCSNIVVILTTGARAILYLLVAIIGVILVCNLNNRQGFIRAASSVLAGCIIVTFLAVADVGDVRYSIYRQTGLRLDAMNLFSSSVEEPGSAEEPGSTEEHGSAEEPGSTEEHGSAEEPGKAENTEQLKQLAEETTSSSDYMRKHLVQYGVEQIKLNPWIGTGDVEYYYQVTEEYGFMQSSHNFLIEAIVCYGCIGLIIVACLFAALIVDTKLFAKNTRAAWKQKIVLVLTVLFYFAFGFVQPTVFNYIICPLFVVTVAVCREALLEESVESSN